MASGGPDILLNFGVDGGGLITSGSGQRMYQQIGTIVQQIESTLTSKIKFGISPDSIKNITSQITALTTGEGKLPIIPVTLDVQVNPDSITAIVSQIQSALSSQIFSLNFGSLNNGNVKLPSSKASGDITNPGTSVPLGSTQIYTKSSKSNKAYLKSQTDIARQADGVVREVTTTFSKAGKALSSKMSLSTKQMAKEVETLLAKYQTLKNEIEKVNVAAQKNGSISKNAYDTYSSKISRVSQYVNNISTAFNSSMAGESNPYDPKKTGLKGIQNSQDAINSLSSFIKYLELMRKEIIASNKELDVLENKYKNLSSVQQKISSIKAAFSSLDDTKYKKDELSSVEKQIANIGKLQQAITAYRASGDKSKFDWTSYGIEGVSNYKQALEQLNVSLQNVAASMKTLKSSPAVLSDQHIIQQAQNLANIYGKFMSTPGSENNTSYFNNSRINEYLKALNTITESDVASKGYQDSLKLLRQNYNYIEQSVKRLNSETKKLAAAHRQEQNAITQTNKIYQEADNYYKKYRSGITSNIQLNQRWMDLMQNLKSGAYGTDTDSARSALAALQSDTKNANAEVLTLWGSIRKLFTDHFGSIAATMAIGTIRNILRSAYNNVLEIDKAMTELRKVTQLTEAQYEAFGHTAATIAKQVGGTIQDTISATADFSRLGYGFEDAQKLAAAALVYKNVGDGISDISEASESIISTLKAFKDIAPEDAMQIVDRFNEVGNRFAISSQGIGEALRRSAAALAASGNNINEAIGLAVAGNTVIQDPDVVGTTLKTVSMFLRAAKTEAEEAGIETEGMVHSVAKLRDDILTIADVDIMLNDSTFKGTYDILNEISEKWDEISDIDQSNLLIKMGGKRNANILASIIENFDEARKAANVAANSIGSAEEENEKYLSSIEGHTNMLKVSFEELSEDVLESDLIKGGIDFLTNVTRLIDEIAKGLGGLKPIVLSLLANGLLNRNKWGFSTAIDGYHQRLTLLGKTIGFQGSEFQTLRQNSSYGVAGALGTAFKDRFLTTFGFPSKKELQSNIDLLNSYSAEIANYKGKSGKINSVYKQWDQSGKFAKATPELRAQIKELNKVAKASGDVTKKTEEFVKAQNDMYNSTSFVTTALRGLANTALNLGVMFVINAAINGISSLIQKAEEEKEVAERSAEEFKKTYQQTDEYIKRIVSLRSELDSSNTTENRSKKIKEELLEIQAKLTESYGDEAKSVNILTGSVEEYVAALRRANQEKYSEQDYDKYAAGTESTRNSFNQQNLTIDDRGFSNALADLYEISVRKNLTSIYKNLGFDTVRQSQGVLTFTGDIFTIDEKLKEAQQEIKKYLNDDTLTQSVRDHYQKAFEYLGQVRADYVDEVISSGQNAFEAWLLNSDTAKSTISGRTYGDLYYDLIVAQQNYQDAVARNDAEAISHYKDSFLASYNDIINELEQGKDPAVTSWFKRTFGDIALSLQDTGNIAREEINSIRNSIQSLASDVVEVKELFDTTISNRAVLQSAFEKVKNNISLTSDEVIKLTDICKDDFPEISKLFTKTSDGYTISANSIIRANEAIGDSVREELQARIADAKRIVSSVVSDGTETRTRLDAATSAGMPSSARDAAIASGAITELTGTVTQEEYKNAKNTIDILELYLSIMDDSIDATNKFSDSLKTFNSTMSTGSAARKEMLENGSLSLSTYASLLELGEKYQSCITIENGLIKFNSNQFEQLTIAKLRDSLATLELERSNLELQKSMELKENGFVSEETINSLTDCQEKINNLQDSIEAVVLAQKKEWSYSFDSVLKTLSSEFSTAAAAQKELSKNGKLSLSTISSLISLGEEYTDVLSTENGVLSFNAEKFQEVAKAKLQDAVATLRMELVEANLQMTLEGTQNHFISEATRANRDRILRELEKASEVTLNFDNYWNDASEEISDNFKESMSQIEHLHNMGLVSDKDYYDALEYNNEQYYAGVKAHESDYLSNIEKVYAGRQQIAKKNNDEELKEIKKSYDRGFLTAEEYLSTLSQKREEFYGAGSQFYGSQFAKDEFKEMQDDIDSITDSIYSERYSELEKANTKILSAEKSFVNSWISLNSEMYEATNPKKYKENLNEIASYIIGLSSLVDDTLNNWGANNSYDDKNISSRNAYLKEWKSISLSFDEEFQNTIKEMRESGEETSALVQQYTTSRNSDILRQAEYQAATYKLKYDRGEYASYDEFEKDILGLSEVYKGFDGKNILDGSFFSNILIPTDKFESWVEKNQKLYDDSIEGQRNYIQSYHNNLISMKKELSPKEFEGYYSEYASMFTENINSQIEAGIIDPDTAKYLIEEFYEQAEKEGANLGKNWLSKALGIDSYDSTLSDLQKLNDGTIESEKSFISKWHALNASTYNDSNSPFYNPKKYKDNLKEIVEYAIDEYTTAFNKGKITAKEFREYVNEELSNSDILGAEYVKDQSEAVEKALANRERTYWEQQKDLVTRYYDTEIEKLQNIKDERDKINQTEKVQLELIKARIELEKAKSQRNQLIFKDGSFYYDYNQEDLMAKEHAVTTAQDAVTENILDSKISDLQSTKSNALIFYDDIIEIIDGYLNDTFLISSSDSDTLEKIKASQSGKDIKLIQSGAAKINPLTAEQLETTGTKDTGVNNKEKSAAAIQQAAETEPADSQGLIKEWEEYITQPIINLAAEIKKLSEDLKKTTVGTLIFGSATQTTGDYLYYDSDKPTSNISSNNNHVSVGDINMTIQGGTSKEMLEQFVSKMSSALSVVFSRKVME